MRVLGRFLLLSWFAVHAFSMSGEAFGQLGATPPSSFRVPEGFQVELLYEVPIKEQGSWVCMCVDLKGRLIVSDQYGKLYRVEVLNKGKDGIKVDSIDFDIGMAQGLLHTKDGLYVDVNGKENSGLHRLIDTNNDDKFDKSEHLIKLNGGGEHGPHAIIEGPDGRLYLCAGNQTNLPDNISKSRVPRHWYEDHLLGRMPDARGFMKDRLAPGGFILSLNPDGSDIEIITTGFRNEYDIAFNDHGELFTYDADMEWDIGTPWYRPTRVNHAISGAEFGWRNGTGKWPEHYGDSFGAVANVGPGSPTGIVFGKGAQFPAKFQRALFISDWSYGVVYSVSLKPEGASYVGTVEPFMSAAPLPVTDLVIHPKDGAMYFAIGGRRVQSALYRLKYTGKESTAPVVAIDSDESAKARKLRQSLEKYHGFPKLGAVEAAMPELGNPDRAIRNAARIALEHQPSDLWREKIGKLGSPQAIITGCIALARSGRAEDQPRIQEALLGLDFAALSRTEKLEMIRAYQLSFTRMGTGSPELRKRIVTQLNGLFPSKEDDTLLNEIWRPC